MGIQRDGSRGGLAISGATPTAIYPGKLLLSYGDTTGNYIATINPDGTGLHKLTSGSTDDSHGVWSPDNSMIAFSRCSADSRCDVWVMQADGTHQRNLTSWESPSYLVQFWAHGWSPDGKKVLAQEDRYTTYGLVSDSVLWVIDVATQAHVDIFHTTQVGYGYAEIGNPFFSTGGWWSPDGSTIAFGLAIDYYTETSGLWTVGSDGSNPAPLYLAANWAFSSPQWWGPDGTALLSCIDYPPLDIVPDGTAFGCFKLAAGGGSTQTLLTVTDEGVPSNPAFPLQWPETPYYLQDVVLSRDGKLVAMQVDPCNIFFANSDFSGAPTAVTHLAPPIGVGVPCALLNDWGSSIFPFYDTLDSAFRYDILWLYNAGITKGCSDERFCPEDPVTRGQMAAFLNRALHLAPSATDYFSDDNASIFEADINALAAAGITKGCTATTFCPTADVTRGQMAAFLVRALGLPGTTTDYFTDDNGTTFESDINRLAAAGITKGCTATTFCPDLNVTRGQMAAFLHRALG